MNWYSAWRRMTQPEALLMTMDPIRKDISSVRKFFAGDVFGIGWGLLIIGIRIYQNATYSAPTLIGLLMCVVCSVHFSFLLPTYSLLKSNLQRTTNKVKIFCRKCEMKLFVSTSKGIIDNEKMGSIRSHNVFPSLFGTCGEHKIRDFGYRLSKKCLSL
jgi:hypothetical protein